jgi:hypothetical protein
VQGCIIITDSVIDRLNEEIVKLGEAKLSAMQESKEYRSGSLHLRYTTLEISSDTWYSTHICSTDTCSVQ